MQGFKNYEPSKDITTLITGVVSPGADIDANGITSDAYKLGDLGFSSFEMEIDLQGGGSTDDLEIIVNVSIDGGTTYTVAPESWAIIDINGATLINKVLQFVNVAGTHLKVTAKSTGATDKWDGTIKARRYRFSEVRGAPSAS